MQSYLYYGGLENADYHPVFGKGHEQLGNGFGHQSLFTDGMKLQPFYGHMAGSGKRRKQRGGAVRKPVESAPMRPMPMPMPMPMPSRASAPSKMPAKAAPPKSLWERAKAFAKEHKLVSRGLSGLSEFVSKIPHKTAQSLVTPLQAASAAASIYGYGRKRKRHARHKKRRARK